MEKFLKGELAKKVKKPRGMVVEEAKKEEEEQEAKEEQEEKGKIPLCGLISFPFCC